MASYKHPLRSVKVASPCSAEWEDMIGTDRRRFCGQCELNVFNLSDMTKREAEELINQAEGRLCVRFFKRTDGTILTRDCPVGLQAIRRRVSRLATATISAVLGFLSGLGLYGALQDLEPRNVMGVMTQEVPTARNGLPISQVDLVDQGEIAYNGLNIGGLAAPPIEKVRLSKVSRIRKK